jgi:DNA polymerase-1
LPRKTFLLLDGNSLINRAYYGLFGRQILTAPDGTPTGAIFAFLNMYLKYIETYTPTHVAAAFDRKEPTFRHGWYDGYKATRRPMDEDLAVQIPLLQELLTKMGVSWLDLAGFEADDLLGTLADRGEKAGMEVLIISGDQDSFQLVNSNITILQPVSRNGRTTIERYDPAAVYERFGVRPEQFVDLKAIMGDSSDNIPGVKGIGIKGATELIARYGSLDDIYHALDEIRPALANKLRDGRELAYLSQELSRIRRDVPLEVDLDDLALKPYTEDLVDLFNRLGFQRMISRLDLDNSPDQEASEQEQPTVSRVGLKHLQEDLARSRPLIAIHVADNREMFWCSQPREIFCVESEYLTSAWSSLGEFEGMIACQDYKQLLHDHDLPLLDGKIHDVTIAAYLLNQLDGRPNLARIYQQLTGRVLYEIQPETGGQIEMDEAWSLSGLAAEQPIDSGQGYLAHAIYEIARQQQTQIGERGIEQLAYEIEMPLAGILADMEKHGFLLDEQVLDQLAIEMDQSLGELQTQIFDLCDCTFNLNSPKQLSEVLFEKLGLKPGKKRSGGSYSTDSEELERLFNDHPAIPLIIEHRQVAKLRSTYIEGLRKVISPSDGRVHTTFNQTLTATGRLSSSEPNLQNIPIRMAAGEKIRRAFIAPPGYVLLDADYSQIELRLLAHLSGDPAMIEAFVENQDIHVNTACRIFALPPEQITAEMRAIAKTMNFSIVYGISDFGLARDLGVPIREAHRYITEYEHQYPEVRRYLNDQVEYAYRHGYVETLTGRRRLITELKAPNRNLRQFGERAAMNTPVQGTAADLIKIAMVRTDQGFRAANLDARLILQVHDELIVEACIQDADRAAKILREAMEGAMQLNVPLVADVRQGVCWADCQS